MTIYLKILFAISLVLLLESCNRHEQGKTNTANLYEVKSQPLHKSLHFTGVIQPLKESTLISPLEAVVDTMHIHYGQMIKKDEVVFTLNSNELQKQYNDTLTEYLKAKDSYALAQAKFTGTDDLWKSGLISKNNYLSEKSSLDTSHVNLIQAKKKLNEMLAHLDESNSSHLSNLNLSDTEKLKQILTSSHNKIHLRAPSNGVMLYPPKSNEDKSSRITTGSLIKSGQVLAIVGDISGISVEIDVPEIDIDKIHTGMKAIVTGVAFGKHQLQGTLVALNAQASNSGNGVLPSFTAIVEVKSLDEEVRSWIKVGMSAAIELSIDDKNQLLIPISAVKREQGKSVVKVQLAQGSIEKRVITTGPAQADSVVVDSGLKVGEKVVYD